jgi:hypothetical protein
MENIDIAGGVSPVKKRQSSRGGKRAGEATSTGKRRGGFAKSTGKRGGGGRNVGGYNVGTRFTPGKPWTPPVSGGTTIIPNFGSGKKSGPDPKDPEGWKKWIEGTPGSEKVEEVLKKGVGTWDYDKDGLPTYAQAWDNNIENVKNKFASQQEYEDHMAEIKAGNIKGASKGQIHDSIHEKKITKTEATPGHWKYYDHTGKEVTEADYNSSLKYKSPGKMKLGGYRAMKNNKK